MGDPSIAIYKIEIEQDRDDATLELVGVFPGPIDYKFPKPRRFRTIQFTITEPAIPSEGGMHSWCVYEVCFWETRILRWPPWRIKVRD